MHLVRGSSKSAWLELCWSQIQSLCEQGLQLAPGMLPTEAPSSACQQACQELLILPDGLLKINKYWEEFHIICTPGVLFNSPKESFKGAQ